jgi:hypothetical protein
MKKKEIDSGSAQTVCQSVSEMLADWLDSACLVLAKYLFPDIGRAFFRKLQLKIGLHISDKHTGSDFVRFTNNKLRFIGSANLPVQQSDGLRFTQGSYFQGCIILNIRLLYLTINMDSKIFHIRMLCFDNHLANASMVSENILMAD